MFSSSFYRQRRKKSCYNKSALLRNLIHKSADNDCDDWAYLSNKKFSSSLNLVLNHWFRFKARQANTEKSSSVLKIKNYFFLVALQIICCFKRMVNIYVGWSDIMDVDDTIWSEISALITEWACHKFSLSVSCIIKNNFKAVNLNSQSASMYRSCKRFE